MVASEAEKAQEKIGRNSLPQLLRVNDVADTLMISSKTVNKLVREGKLGCVQVTPKDRRFTVEQVEDYIAKMTINRPIDRPKSRRVRSAPPKGGEKSLGVCRADLRKEMRQWQ